MNPSDAAPMNRPDPLFKVGDRVRILCFVGGPTHGPVKTISTARWTDEDKWCYQLGDVGWFREWILAPAASLCVEGRCRISIESARLAKCSVEWIVDYELAKLRRVLCKKLQKALEQEE